MNHNYIFSTYGLSMRNNTFKIQLQGKSLRRVNNFLSAKANLLFNIGLR